MTTRIDDRPAALTSRLSALLGCAHACEQALLAGLPAAQRDADGDPEHWSARAVLAHNSDFRREQIVRLRAAAAGIEPPAFGQVDHRDPAIYLACRERPWPAVRAAVDADLSDTVAALDAAAGHLADSARLPWMRGRPLWAQVLVRGVWHPLGHLATCLVQAGRPDQAAAAVEAVVGAARALGFPAAPGGVAFGVYTLAAVRALSGERAEAVRLLRDALADDPALAANAARDPDFDAVRGDPAFPA